ncbi:MAG: mechanosensitive ion channel domain-containing protein [Myxococcota bacterium]
MKRALAITTVMAATFVAAGAAAQETPDLEVVSKLANVVRWSGLLASTLVIVGAGLLLRFIGGIGERFANQFATYRLTIQKFESFARFFVYFATVGVVITLSFRIDEAVLAVVGGALAFAVGFAMRDLVAAVIAGIMIMFDRPFQVGDRVTYAGEYGDIIQIGLRSVRMRTLDDNIVTVPNNKILTDVTSSGNFGELDMQVKMVFHIGVDQDLDRAERLVKESILTSRYVFLEKPVVTLVSQKLKDDYVALEIVGKAYVLDTKYESAFVADVNRRVLRAFRHHQIKPPAMIHRLDLDEETSATLRSLLG